MDLAKIKLQEVITLSLLASDFIGNFYTSNDDCAISRATKRLFNTNDVVTGGVSLDVTKNNLTVSFEIDLDFHFAIFESIQNEVIENKIKSDKVMLKVKLTCVDIYTE